MGKRQLLFVTYLDDNLDEGVSYAVDLARAMFEDITLLLVKKKSRLFDRFETLMTAVTFAEAGEHDTASQTMTQDEAAGKERMNTMLDAFVKRCRTDGIHVRIEEVEGDAISVIRAYLKGHTGIDKVVLSPAVTGSSTVSARDLNNLVRTASRPIVTMTRQACAPA